MQRGGQTYGYFSSQRFVHRQDQSMTDEIAINPAYFGLVPVLEVLQPIAHEMVHAWQFLFGKPGRRRYHNKEWADKMESIGLMPSSTGKPGGARTGEKMADYAIENGRFVEATTSLLATGFQVSWLDRFLPAQMATGSVALTTGDGGGGGGAAGLIVPQAGNRSNRVKYRCPSCAAQVWGKPDLRILCGGEQCTATQFEAVA